MGGTGKAQKFRKPEIFAGCSEISHSTKFRIAIVFSLTVAGLFFSALCTILSYMMYIIIFIYLFIIIIIIIY